MWWLIGILIYVFVLILSAIGEIQTSADWVKRIFWPITVVVYILGMIIWLLIWIPRKLFKGLCICFYEIKDFFVDIFYSAIEDED